MWPGINGGRDGCCYNEYESHYCGDVFNMWPGINGGRDGCSYNEYESHYCGDVFLLCGLG
jgi:hypothetical protein